MCTCIVIFIIVQISRLANPGFSQTIRSLFPNHKILLQTIQLFRRFYVKPYNFFFISMMFVLTLFFNLGGISSSFQQQILPRMKKQLFERLSMETDFSGMPTWALQNLKFLVPQKTLSSYVAFCAIFIVEYDYLL